MFKRGIEIPVIMLSSRFDVSNFIRPKTITNLLYKPVKPDRLKKTIAQTLQNFLAVPESPAKILHPDQFDPNRKIRVLLAEDNVVNQKVFSRILDKLGYVTDLASDGAEAVECVGRQAYDIVFMDIQMPNLDGMGATKVIRDLGNQILQPRIVALSAEINPEVTNACVAAGMDMTLQKPVRTDQIIQTLLAFKTTIND